MRYREDNNMRYREDNNMRYREDNNMQEQMAAISIPVGVKFQPHNFTVTCRYCGETFYNVRVVVSHTNLLSPEGEKIDRIHSFNKSDVCACLQAAWTFFNAYVAIGYEIMEGDMLN